MSNRPHINYGICHGGPFSGQTIVDTNVVTMVFVDRDDVPPALWKALGAYHFADGAWTWRESGRETPDSVNN